MTSGRQEKIFISPLVCGLPASGEVESQAIEMSVNM